jgi:LacI family transcriptional regulator
MSSIPHVALLIETSRAYGRNILRGVKRYISEHQPWSVFLESRALHSPVPPWLPNWRGDGILSRSSSQQMLDAIAKTGAPAVELRATKLRHQLPFVGNDSKEIGKLVADHLLDRGFRSFGCYEIDAESFYGARSESFIEVVTQRGCRCECIHAKRSSERPAQWEQQQAELIDWVKGLSKPAGVMACTDQLGFWLLDACQRAGIAVPEEVSVVGIGDDESLCELATPRLSSVDCRAVKVGYEAASLLSRLMNGESPPSGEILIPPGGIVVRASSDVVAVDDPIVARALRFIREQAREGIQVEDVARFVHSSRSTLQRRMRRVIDRSPQEEITRVKLNWVRQLLVETNLPLEVVAHKSGFTHVQYMIECFRVQFGKTPGQFRQTMRFVDR